MDVSQAVDTLFGGVVPERMTELKALWGEHQERVRLLDADRFLVQQLYGTVQISELALRQIWLTGYAAWRAVDTFNRPLTLASIAMAPIDLEAWRTHPGFSRRETAFAELFTAITAIAHADSIDAFSWPAGVPHPEHGLTITDQGLKATFDLICMAGAYVFAHEVRHNVFESARNAPDELLDEERECDRWALALMLEQAANYAIDLGWPPELVRAKRILGVVIAQLVILALTPRTNWDSSDGHPPVRERLRAVLDAATDPVPDWFWTTIAAMLLGFATRSGVVIERVVVPSDIRQLAYLLCDRLRPD